MSVSMIIFSSIDSILSFPLDIFDISIFQVHG